MRVAFALILLIIISVSCESDDNALVESLNGTYSGIFYRTSPETKYSVSEVTIAFNRSDYIGSSSEIKYPAICYGTYELTGNNIEFFDQCIWTAEFDWSLILSGKFNIEKEGDYIVIKRSYNNSIIDTYKLKKTDSAGYFTTD